MIPVALPPAEEALDARTRKWLAKRHAKAAALAPHHPGIDPSWKSFRQTKTGKSLADRLASLFHGKCAYCEQESAKDIDHYCPKSRYPNLMFQWTNFLWACKNCDTDKLDQFPLDPNNNPLLINPVTEEPLDYFMWNFVSGKMIPHPQPARGERALLARDLFKLDQFSITDERRNKLENVVYLLSHVVKEDPVGADTIARFKYELAPHRPWLGIIRQLFGEPARYTSLVAAARAKLPEIDQGLAVWI